MAVDPRWSAVSGPSGVCNASMRVKDLGEVWLLLCNELLELDDFANLVLLVSFYRETCRVVTAVLKTRQAYCDQWLANRWNMVAVRLNWA
jgi:hypothetical protein